IEHPLRDRSYDVALSIRSIAHHRDWPRFDGELCRVSRSAAIVDYPSARSANRFAGRFFDAKHRIEGDTREFAIFRPVEIVDVFAAAGFRVAETEPQFVLPMAVHRLHGSAVAGHLLEALAGAAGLTRRFGSPVLVRADRIPS
ncbi:MAG: hypothetical protein QOD06_1201, partial [Candidatus Binatota bacterium]|nr:hypothetical protein [Candidatus Binatota bacterium]